MSEQMKVMKAFHVQGDEYGVVVFANSNVVARREGALELDEQFNSVSCKRVPGLDSYAKAGKVASRVLVEDFGFWQECAWCSHQVDNETEERVWDGEAVYCSIECQARRINQDMDWEKEKKRQQEAEQAGINAAIAEFPGITDVIATTSYKGDVIAHFHFPGGSSRASWAIGSKSIYPAATDAEAFKSFLASIRAVQHD